MIKTPINNGTLQSDLDFVDRKPLNADLSDYAGTGIEWNEVTGKFESSGGGGGSIGTVLGTRVSVKDAPYNAAGDGVTDDTAAIQAAMVDVVAAGGGTVYFPRGVYLVNGAWNSYWHCILLIPFIDGNTTSAVTLELAGENNPAWGVFGPYNNHNASTIICTRTDGAASDYAIIAGNVPMGTGPVAYNLMNNIMVKIKGLNFQCGDNPTFGGVRLDGIGWAFVEDTSITGGGSEPMHGTTGLWMPNTINFGMNYINHVTSSGFDTGVKTGEHLRAPQMSTSRCKTGVEFISSNYPSWANIQIEACVQGVKFSGYHVVDLMLEIEHQGSAWYATTADVYDPSNNGTGNIRYYIGNGMSGGFTLASVTGGAGLNIHSMFSGDANYCSGAGAGGSTPGATVTANRVTLRTALYIGTDLRLVPISGGGKLQARNASLNTWADVDQWTNP